MTDGQRVYRLVVTNDDYNQGREWSADDVRKAVEGDGCGAECETRAFKVNEIEEI